jgi:hypothetical protein
VLCLVAVSAALVAPPAGRTADETPPALHAAQTDAATMRAGQTQPTAPRVAPEQQPGPMAASLAPAATIVWRAQDNPHVVNGTYTVPVGTTLVMEAGVVVQINPNSTLDVQGALQGQGTAANRITINGSGYTTVLAVSGTSELDYTDNAGARIDPKAGGSLVFTNCRFQPGYFFKDGYTDNVPAFVQLEHCTFDGPNVTLTLSFVTLRLRDVSFTNGAYLRLLYSYIWLDDVRANNATQDALGFALDNKLYLNNVSVTNSTQAGLLLGGGNRGGNYFLGPQVTLANNLYPVRLYYGGLLPGSNVPATGNANNYVAVDPGANSGDYDWRGPIVFAPLAVPYVIVDPLNLVSGTWTMLPGVDVRFGPGFAGISDQSSGGLIARGTAQAPVHFSRFDPAESWGGIGFTRTGNRIANVLLEGSKNGVTTTVNNGGFVYVDDLVVRNNDVGMANGVIAVGSRFLNNAVGYSCGGPLAAGGILNGGPSSPNSFVGNTVGARVLNTTRPMRNNWWNSPTGPRHPNNPGGTGDPAEGGVDFIPFLTTPPDYSDTPPIVRQHEPFGTYEPGQKLTISWDVTDDQGIVAHRILFNPAGNYPTGFQTVADQLPGTARAYEWTVPAIGFQTTYGYSTVRVVAIDTAGHERFDDKFIQIPSGEVTGTVTFTTNFNRTFKPGERFPVTWTASGYGQDSLFNMYVEVGSEPYYVSQGGAFLNYGSWDARVPFISADTARIIIVQQGSRNRVRWHFSPYFKIRPDARIGDAPPAISVQTPAPGSSYPAGSVVPVTWRAEDDEALRSFNVQASYDGGLRWTTLALDLPANTTTYNFQTAPGAGFADVRVRVIAVDQRFQETSAGADRSFMLTQTPPPNMPPTVALTDPTADSLYVAGATVTLNATAADSDGTVTQVEFFDGATLVGADTNAPYTVNWNAAPGPHTLTARATDNSGAQTTSAPVNVNVNAQPRPPQATPPGALWGTTFNGPSSGQDEKPFMALDAAGNAYVAAQSRGIGTGVDIVVTKYDPNGNELWVARFNGTGNGTDYPTGLTLDAAGNIYVIGSTWRGFNSTPGNTEFDYVTLKYDTNGNRLWTRYFSGTNAKSFDDVPYEVLTDAAGNVYVTGASEYSGIYNFLVNQIATLKYDANGTQLWLRTFDTNDHWGTAGSDLALDAQGNVYVTGTGRVATVNVNTTTDDIFTIKYTTDGTQLWVAQYDTPGTPTWSDFDRAERIHVDASGAVVVLGARLPEGGDADVLLLRYTSDGLFDRERVYQGAGRDDPNDWAFNSAGDIYVTGITDNQAEYGVAFTLKFDKLLNPLWARTYDGPAPGGYDAGFAIALDSAANAYVAIPSLNTDGDYDYAIAKYLADGAEAGVNRYEGPAALDDIPQEIALDRENNVYVTGETRATAGDFNLLTIKLAATTPPAPAGPGNVLISEFRFNAFDDEDEFVELYNNTNAPLTVQTSDGSAGWAVVALDAVGLNMRTLAIVPNGTIIPARGHYLLAGSAYSLAAQVPPDQTYADGMEDNSSLALFATADAARFGMATRLDAVGFDGATGTMAALFREGAPMTGINQTEPSFTQWSFVRKQTSGTPQDTGDNLNDFARVSPTSAIGGSEPAILGAAGPENLASPVERNAQMKASLVDPQQPSTSAPNRVRDAAANSCGGSNCALGTLTIRRRFTNKTGAMVTTLRFRIIDITTLNTPATGTQADLRALDSIDVMVTTSSGNVLVKGTSVGAPVQSLGGGLNSAYVVNLPGGALAPNASVNVQFVLGVQTGGSFRFLVNVEAGSSAPTSGPQKVTETSMSK